MAIYRLHFVLEDRLLAGQAFHADGDVQAKAYVEGRRDGRAAKLWNLERLVGDYAAKSS